MLTLTDGIIRVGDAPESWGFNIDSFEGDSYLWKTGNRIMISMIFAQRKGSGKFSALVKAIEADGFTVAIPTPLGQMTAILVKWGFKPALDGDCEVWTR